MSPDHVSWPLVQCTNVTFPFCTGSVHVVVLGIAPAVVAVTGCVPALLAVPATPSPTTARTASANDARRNLIRVLSSGFPAPNGAGSVPQRGKKGYASLKATRRVAFLKRRFARLDPLTSVTQPAPQALVNIVTNHRLQLTLLDPQVARRG